MSNREYESEWEIIQPTNRDTERNHVDQQDLLPSEALIGMLHIPPEGRSSDLCAALNNKSSNFDMECKTVNIFDLFGPKDPDDILEYLWSLDSQKCIRVILAIRDKSIAWGACSNRQTCIKCMIWLRRNHSEEYLKAIHIFIKVGYYKDLLYILDHLTESDQLLGTLDYIELEIFAETLRRDYDSLCELRSKSGRHCEEITICAKWAPSENKKWHKYAIRISKLINPGSRRHREFYRDILSRLRQYLSCKITEKFIIETIDKKSTPLMSLIKYQGHFVVSGEWTQQDEDQLTVRIINMLSQGYNVNKKYIEHIFQILKHLESDEQNIVLSSINDKIITSDKSNVSLELFIDFSSANLKLLFVMYYICVMVWNSANIKSVKLDSNLSLNKLIKSIVQISADHESTDQHKKCKIIIHSRPAMGRKFSGGHTSASRSVHSTACDKELSPEQITWYPLEPINIVYSKNEVYGIHPIIFNHILEYNTYPLDFIQSLQSVVQL